MTLTRNILKDDYGYSNSVLGKLWVYVCMYRPLGHSCRIPLLFLLQHASLPSPNANPDDQVLWPCTSSTSHLTLLHQAWSSCLGKKKKSKRKMSSVQNRGPALWNLDFILFSVIEIDHNDLEKRWDNREKRWSNDTYWEIYKIPYHDWFTLKY